MTDFSTWPFTASPDSSGLAGPPLKVLKHCCGTFSFDASKKCTQICRFSRKQDVMSIVCARLHEIVTDVLYAWILCPYYS